MSVKPRIRIFLLMLAVTLAVPATASANPWASINSLPMCVSDTLPAAATATDDTTVPSDWRQRGRQREPAGHRRAGLRVEDRLRHHADRHHGAASPAPARTASCTAPRRRAPATGRGWVEDFVYVDTTLPVDTSTVPAGWQHDKATITLSGTDVGDQSGVVAHGLRARRQRPDRGQRRRHVRHHRQRHAHAATQRRRHRGQRERRDAPHRAVDSAAPVDTTTVPAGWVTTPSVDVSVAGTDAGGSGVAQIEWELVEDARSATVAGAGPVNVTVSGEGVHTLRTRITDGDGRSRPGRSSRSASTRSCRPTTPPSPRRG